VSRQFIHPVEGIPLIQAAKGVLVFSPHPCPLLPPQTLNVTLRKVAAIEVLSLLVFWATNSSYSSFCSPAARPLFAAASKAFMVGP
jgi:hypothetical protein